MPVRKNVPNIKVRPSDGDALYRVGSSIPARVNEDVLGKR